MSTYVASHATVPQRDPSYLSPSQSCAFVAVPLDYFTYFHHASHLYLDDRNSLLCGDGQSEKRRLRGGERAHTHTLMFCVCKGRWSVPCGWVRGKYRSPCCCCLLPSPSHTQQKKKPDVISDKFSHQGNKYTTHWCSWMGWCIFENSVNSYYCIIQ